MYTITVLLVSLWIITSILSYFDNKFMIQTQAKSVTTITTKSELQPPTEVISESQSITQLQSFTNDNDQLYNSYLCNSQKEVCYICYSAICYSMESSYISSLLPSNINTPMGKFSGSGFTFDQVFNANVTVFSLLGCLRQCHVKSINEEQVQTYRTTQQDAKKQLKKIPLLMWHEVNTGPCINCTVTISHTTMSSSTNSNYSEMFFTFHDIFQKVSIQPTSFDSSTSCQWNSSFTMKLPKEWLEFPLSNENNLTVRLLNITITDVKFLNNGLIKMILNENAIRALVNDVRDDYDNSLEMKNPLISDTDEIPFLQIDGLSSPSIPRRSILENLVFEFYSQGCISILQNNKNQTVNQLRQDLIIPLNFSKPLLVGYGAFTNINIESTNPKINELTDFIITMKTTTMLTEHSNIQLTTLLHEGFDKMYQPLSYAQLVEPFSCNLTLHVDAGLVTLSFPDDIIQTNSFLRTNRRLANGSNQSYTKLGIRPESVSSHPLIYNNDILKLRLGPFMNPPDIHSIPQTMFISATTLGYDVVLDTTADFYALAPAHRPSSLQVLDLLTDILYFICLVVSIIIMRRHRLTFSHSTVWTDLMSIYVLCSYITGIISYTLWMASPSSLLFYLNSLHNYFITLMIVSLCFHWGSVLSLSFFRKIKLKSIAASIYISMSLAIFIIFLISVLMIRSKFSCVFNTILKCSDATSCPKIPSANGMELRVSSKKCDMESYYIIMSSLFLFYTIVIMVLGCMVMLRGRSIMLSSNTQSLPNSYNPNASLMIRSDHRIRRSLAIFYMILSITCVLYITAQIMLIIEHSINERELSDVIWYIFVIWLPYCVPPLLLLFMQWNPTTSATSMYDPSTAGAVSNDVPLELASSMNNNEENFLTPNAVMVQVVSDNQAINYLEYQDQDAMVRKNKSIDNEKIMTLKSSPLADDNAACLPLSVRLHIPSTFSHKYYVSLEICILINTFPNEDSLLRLNDPNNTWHFVGATEHASLDSISPSRSTNQNLDVLHENNSSSRSSSSTVSGTTTTNSHMFGSTGDNNEEQPSICTIPFLAVFELPLVAPPKNILLRFTLHCVPLENEFNSISPPSPGQYHSLCAFVTIASTVLEATRNGEHFTTFATDIRNLCMYNQQDTVLQFDVVNLFQKNLQLVTLSIQSLLINGLNNNRKDDIISFDNALSARQSVVFLSNTTVDNNNASGNGMNGTSGQNPYNRFDLLGNNNISEPYDDHRKIGNLTRFFQYDSDDQTNGGLVIEELKECIYANLIPRLYLQLLIIGRNDSIEKYKKELVLFNNKRKISSIHGFYGNLIGQIQEESDSTRIRKWLEGRIAKEQEYFTLLKESIEYYRKRDAEKQYFKASIDKKSVKVQFLPINLHIGNMFVGPTNAFMNSAQQIDYDHISIYDTITVGAMSAHTYKFSKGGLLSYEKSLYKHYERMNLHESALSNDPNSSEHNWNIEKCDYLDSLWDASVRLEMCFSQALTTLVASFIHKLDLILRSSNHNKYASEEMLRRISTLGYLFQVESLLSTHGNEVGMLEDMHMAVKKLNSVCFVIKVDGGRKDSISSLSSSIHKSSGRFSWKSVTTSVTRRTSKAFRSGTLSNIKEEETETKKPNKLIMKVEIYERKLHKTNPVDRLFNDTELQYQVVIKCNNPNEITIPDRLLNGGEIVTNALLFTQGINEMQTIANNAERSKTELQNTINKANLKKLKLFCERYCRLLAALPGGSSFLANSSNVSDVPTMTNKDMEIMELTSGDSLGERRIQRPTMEGRLYTLNDKTILLNLNTLESLINNAANSKIKTKCPEILTMSSDLCRQLGGSRITVCKSAKDRTAMSVTLEQGRILYLHHHLPSHRLLPTVQVMRSHGVRIENAYKNTGKRQYAFNKIQRSLLPEEYKCPEIVSGSGNVS